MVEKGNKTVLDFGNDLEYLDAMLYLFELTNLMK
jgi:hypothetical protein